MSQSEDLDAINEYMNSTPIKTPKAAELRADWVAWWQNLGWYGKNIDSNSYNVARNKRNVFNLANTTTAEEHAAVTQSNKTGITTEQMFGLPDPRDAHGNFPIEKPPLIPPQYKLAVGVGAAAAGALFIYGLSQSLPRALLVRRAH